MKSTYADGLDLDEGLIYNVEFDDGTARLMRKIDPNLRAGYPWIDVATREVVIQSWLIIPGNKGPKPIRFSNPDTMPSTPAFGGAVVTKMELAIKLGGTVSWASQAGGNYALRRASLKRLCQAKVCLIEHDFHNSIGQQVLVLHEITSPSLCACKAKLPNRLEHCIGLVYPA